MEGDRLDARRRTRGGLRGVDVDRRAGMRHTACRRRVRVGRRGRTPGARRGRPPRRGRPRMPPWRATVAGRILFGARVAVSVMLLDMLPEPALSLRGVRKRFGEIEAVAGIDLDVSAGTCLGLLGPNGAGKSTTMRMLTAQAIADAGEISVLGHRLPADSKAARARCGVVPQLDNLDFELTVRQNLAVFARLYRVPRVERAAAVDRALELANLRERAESVVDELSGGMRRRLLVARGLVHRPELLLLDEPTVGLDPQVRSELWSLIDSLRAEGVTILMSTHYIEEAERLADEVAIMAEGRIVARGRPAELVAEHVGREVLEVYGPPGELESAERGAGGAGFATRRSGPVLAILGAEQSNGALPAGYRRPASLEDVFVLLTGQGVE
jgi:lipooligosaccharide transport system ATP-binding protein